MNTSKLIAIIPARGGSKRIPRKNIKLFHGKPIIAYSIEAAIQSGLFDEVVVSTDDEEIELIAKQFNALIHKRSAKNADDFATTSDVIDEVLKDLESTLGTIDVLCCIYPTSPLIQKNDLQLAFKTFQDNKSDVVLAASPFSFPPQRGFTLENDKLKLVAPECIQMRSQDLQKNYHDAGAFYFVNPESFKITKNLWEGKINAYILNETKIQDIDSEEDWKMAELKYQLLISEKNKETEFVEWTNKEYKCLKNQIYVKDQFKLEPIRSIDRFQILKWRNEQVYHLRQNGLLSADQQNSYFQNTVSLLFHENQPKQILFSFLKNDVCIGYGGLVHINWIDKHAEISFVMDTALEQDFFEENWLTYLNLIEPVAFDDLNLHKIFTYAFDLRPHLYKALELSGYQETARLKEHCFFNNQFIDAVIHTKFKKKKINKTAIKLRKADNNDAELLFNWVNDANVRKNSINPEPINWENHLIWFNKKINDNNSKILILFSPEYLLGQIRIDLVNAYWNIDYSIDNEFRGIGLGKEMVKLILKMYEFYNFKATVKKENLASIKIFQNLGFKQIQTLSDDYYYFEYKK
ncbi:MAG: hypothetical protein RI883_717 [Bacteroidota bacterium]|jgi:pseudaminic acid cytidylyltransferase